MNFFWVGLGGFCGAAGRYALGQWLPAAADGFPRTTLLINVCGAFVLGLLGALSLRQPQINRQLLLFLQVGLCGGFTTFSTFAVESVALLQRGEIGAAAAYMMLSVGLSLGAVLAAYWLLR